MHSTATIPNEAAMQQAWRYRMWGAGTFRSVQGQTVRILDAGVFNNGAGPDFSNARIKIGQTVLAGCVEIHRLASDWHRHGHDGDEAYRNVVLHVVGKDDCRITAPDGSEVLQLVMDIETGFENFFNRLLTDAHYVLPMCGDRLDMVKGIFRTDWLTGLAFERLFRKADDTRRCLADDNGDWLQTVFIMLARGLGFGTNADNMERVARSTPFRKLLRHTDDNEAVEAILLGQGGLLNFASPADSYEEKLCREYAFYRQKYDLTPISQPIWHLSARNVANTPYRRLAFLARLICTHGADIASRLTTNVSAERFHRFLNVDVSTYWQTHYAFARPTASRLSALGAQSRDLLIINVLTPLVFARGLETNNTEMLDAAVNLWQTTAPEKNAITRGFERFEVEVDSAFTSQALIQLHREYCEKRKCLECRLGHRLLSNFITFS